MLFLVRHGEADDAGDLTAQGQEQAQLLGERLRGLSVDAIEHGPLPRARQTAAILARAVPATPVRESELLTDVVPPFGPRDELPAPYVAFLSEVGDDEAAADARTAISALAHYARPDQSRRVLITHNFVVGWFVRAALDAPQARWMGLNACHCSITAIRYLPDRPPLLVTFNDVSHLPDRLQWTQFPPDRRL